MLFTARRAYRSVCCFATISLIDVILIWQALVVLNHRVENLHPLRKASRVILGNVYWTGPFVEVNAGTLLEGGKFGKARFRGRDYTLA